MLKNNMIFFVYKSPVFWYNRYHMKKSREIVAAMTEPRHPQTLAEYLNQCRVRALCETDTHTPPTAEEVRFLIAYLRSKGVKAVIVGSAAVFHHLRSNTRNFRPTVDVDIFVDKPLPALPDGWSKDPEALGVNSWISPSGGYVDFMQKSHEFPTGEKYPASVETQPDSDADYPVATALDLLKMKLNSAREKDLADAIALVRSLGKLPILNKLNRTQKDNWGLVSQWFKLRPQGAYGE
jgi:hypothetical protein